MIRQLASVSSGLLRARPKGKARLGAAAAAAAARFKVPADFEVAEEGLELKGLSILKGETDPVIKADDQYPAWLWTLLPADSPCLPGREDFIKEMTAKAEEEDAAAKAAAKVAEEEGKDFAGTGLPPVNAVLSDDGASWTATDHGLELDESDRKEAKLTRRSHIKRNNEVRGR